MKIHCLLLTAIIGLASLLPAAPPPPPPGGGKGKDGPSQESAEMQALLKSFNLTTEQQAKYDSAKKKTGEEMRRIHVGKEDGSLSMDQVLKQALVSHKAFNAAVKEILSAYQYARWEPLRESDHHKIAAAHKARDEAEAARKSQGEKKAEAPQP